MENKTLMTDFYELTMANGYFQTDYKDTITYFDLFVQCMPNCHPTNKLRAKQD